MTPKPETLSHKKEKEAYDRYICQREQRVERMAASRGRSLLAGIQCAEAKHLLRGDDEDPGSQDDDNDLSFEIEGAKAGKSLFGGLIQNKSATLLKKKETHSERFLSKYNEEDFESLFSENKKIGGRYEESEEEEEEDEGAIKYLKRPKYMASKHSDDEEGLEVDNSEE